MRLAQIRVLQPSPHGPMMVDSGPCFVRFGWFESARNVFIQFHIPPVSAVQSVSPGDEAVHKLRKCSPYSFCRHGRVVTL